MIFSRFVEAKAARAAKCFLEETMFEPETGCLESYIECLFENELVEEALDVFEQLKMAGHCVSLKTWNSTMLQSVKAKRVDVVWKLYGDMLEYDVVGDVDTIGYLVQAFCMENNTAKCHKTSSTGFGGRTCSEQCCLQ
ncbi:Pentatricopeptide repeat-containing protein [Forsythia ovata]|uniref:Pentatricopeptide repeat-containing protein n=1 Tax=Forsythia ovata TaxID=205694 RepID=A0ABD1U5J9_9LAMI